MDTLKANMTLRSEEDIRKRIAELEARQKAFSWSDPERAVYAKTHLRAQIKGLKFALHEDEGYNISME